MFYSNCLLESMKAKIKDPKKVKLTFIPPTKKHPLPHWMWTDGKNDYDFGVERDLKWYESLWFKGEITKRELGFNRRWKRFCQMMDTDRGE